MTTRSAALADLREKLAIVDALYEGRETMLEPQDLPGRFGRVVKAIDRLIKALKCESVLAGGWAVWRHGFEGRFTHDVDIALAADRVEEFLRAAAVSGFEVQPQPKGRWPKVIHKDTKVKVDILPEGERPGTASHPAPTTIPHPAQMGARRDRLRYITLERLIELKLAAGRAQDDADVIKLIQVNPDRIDAIRQHLATVHADYVASFNRLVQRAEEQVDH